MTQVLTEKKLYAPFLSMAGSAASRLEPLRGGSLLFSTKFLEIPDTHFIDLGRMKGYKQTKKKQRRFTKYCPKINNE